MKQCKRHKCGKSFEPTRPKQEYCSDNCRKYHHNEQKVGSNKDQSVAAIVKQAIKLTDHDLPPAGLDKAAMLRWYREH